MTKDETIKLLNSYQKNKKAESIIINHIEELERNLITAKSIDFTKENSFSSSYTPTLPHLIIAKLIDMKEHLIKDIYQNSILLNKLENIIYEIGVENVNAGIILSNKFILGLTNTALELKFNYSKVWIIKSLRKAEEAFYQKVKDIDYKLFIQEIEKESNITREELENFYRNIF